MVKTAQEMRSEIKKELRGGVGNISTLHLLEKAESLDKCKMFARMTLMPGVSIGEHPHDPEAEIYYCLSGEITVGDNGVEKLLHPGDVMFTGGGSTHWAKNNTDYPAEMIAIVLP